MKKVFGLFIILTFLIPLYGVEEEKNYTNYSFARLSCVEGKSYIQRADDLGFETGELNMPIVEGDRVGTTEGRAEIYLGKKNHIRLDNETKVDFLNLPKRGYDLIRVRVWSGHVIFDINFLEKEKNIEIHTSDVSLYLLTEGLYRIDVKENGKTDVLVFSGLLEAAGSMGSVLVKDEQQLEVSEGRFLSQPSSFYTVADSFDRWSEERSSIINQRLAGNYLPEELEDFEYELANYGHWTNVDSYGYVWVPNRVGDGWRPYYHGRWMWLPTCGWTWLPYEPWGWCTFHYGRWHWNVGLGWYWIPHTRWGPGWVHWYWGYGYYGWSPLSWYGYPVVILNNRFYGHYSGRYHPVGSRSLTVIRKDQLRSPDISKVALSREAVQKVGKLEATQRTLNVKPGKSKISVNEMGKGRYMLEKSRELRDVKGVNRIPQGESDYRLRSMNLDNKRTPIPSENKSKSIGKKEISEKNLRLERRVSDSSTSKPYIKEGSYGYPSSPDISVRNNDSRRITRSRSFINSVNKYISGRNRYIRSSSSSNRISKSRSTSRSTRSSISSRRGRSVSSRGTSSSSRSVSKSRSSGRSSGSSSKGTSRKKK